MWFYAMQIVYCRHNCCRKSWSY